MTIKEYIDGIKEILKNGYWRKKRVAFIALIEAKHDGLITRDELAEILRECNY